MTLIADLSFITSFIGILGFACWDVGAEIPILYPFGAFLGKWWFHDSFSPGKQNPFNPYAKDGPPAVGKIGQGGSIPFPYPQDPFSSSSTVTTTYSDTLKLEKKYTPVTNLYGITNVKSDDPSNTDLYIADAANANDYIARRFLGPHVSSVDLKNLADKSKIYNKSVFKDGSPFVAATIGPNNPNSKDWDVSSYSSSFPPNPLIPPLTSTNQIGGVQPMTGTAVSINDYSGMEYDNPAAYSGTNESIFCSTSRTDSYKQDQYGNLINSNQVAAWAGEYPVDPVNQGGFNFPLLNSFYDPNYDGVTSQTTNNNGVTTYVTPLSWGTNNWEDLHVANYGNKISNTQNDYIIGYLSQENPISKMKDRKESSSNDDE